MRTSSEPAWASAATCWTVDVDVGGVGVGHALHDNGCAAADRHRAGAFANAHADTRAAGQRFGGDLGFAKRREAVFGHCGEVLWAELASL